MKNNVTEVQEMVLKQLKRLDDDNLMEESGAKEIERGNTISKNAKTFAQLVNLNIRITDFAEKQAMDLNQVNDFLGIQTEDEN